MSTTSMSVIGTGYLGATHACVMASLGYNVLGVDIDEKKVENLNNGHIPFYEPDLRELLHKNLDSGKLRFTTDFSEAGSYTNVHFLGVGTPQQRDNKAADVSQVCNAIKKLAPHLQDNSVIIGKSTVPVGTSRKQLKFLREKYPSKTIHLIWNPEFLREGFGVQDTLHPDRIVIGLEHEEDLYPLKIIQSIYNQQIQEGIPFLTTNYETAELIKTAANAFLATKISFINAMAEICEHTGGDVKKLAEALGHDVRIGPKFLGAGIGFGGGCLPKDIRAFQARAEELGLGKSLSFLQHIDEINVRRREQVVTLSKRILGGLNGKQIAILGLAFKPNSDDIRESPALDIALQLHSHGAMVVAHDPKALENAQAFTTKLSYSHDIQETLRGAECTILATEWEEYCKLNPNDIGKLVAHKKIIDGRNALDRKAFRDANWDYYALGLGRLE